MAELVPTRNGGFYLVFDQYMFVVNRKAAGKIFWRCSDRELCRASITTTESYISDRSKATHAHPNHSEKNCKNEKN